MRTDVRAHRRTDMAKVIVAFRDFEKTPKKLKSHKMPTELNTFRVFVLFLSLLYRFLYHS